MKYKVISVVMACIMSAMLPNVHVNAESVTMPESGTANTVSEVVLTPVVHASVGFAEVMDNAEYVDEEPETYTVDIIDGYLTEESIYSICKYVGDIYDVSPYLLQAVAWSESRYRVEATSYCDAKGLCQIMEIWHEERMERLGVTDIYDPYSNVLVCADLISELRDYEHGYDMTYVLMAYNMGPGGAREAYEAGSISDYAVTVLNKAQELEGVGDNE